MKKIVVILSIFIQVIAFGKIEVDGIDYLSKEEVEERGIEVAEEYLIIGETRLDFLEGKVSIAGYEVEFPEAKVKKEEGTYYNSYLTNEFAYAYEEEDPKENIVSLSPGITEKIFALGLGENIVGRTIYCNYPEKTREIQEVGSMLEPSFEKVVVKSPEIVLMEAHYNEGFVGQLKRVGVDYRIYQTPKSIDEMFDHLLDLGKELGVEARARVLIASLRSKSTEYLKKSESHGEKPTIYYVLGTGRAEYTAGGDTFIGDLLTYGGGKNIAESKKGWNYSLEELIANNPEYIIGSEKDIEILRTEKKYSLLRAVREGKLIEVDTNIYNLPGVRAVNEGIPIIYNSIY